MGERRRHCQGCHLSTRPQLSGKGTIHWGKEALENNHVTRGRARSLVLDILEFEIPVSHPKLRG